MRFWHPVIRAQPLWIQKLVQFHAAQQLAATSVSLEGTIFGNSPMITGVLSIGPQMKARIILN